MARTNTKSVPTVGFTWGTYDRLQAYIVEAAAYIGENTTDVFREIVEEGLKTHPAPAPKSADVTAAIGGILSAWGAGTGVRMNRREAAGATGYAM